MFEWLTQWVLSALTLLLVSKFVPGFYVEGPVPAMFAAGVIGLLNASLGQWLKAVPFPLVILTFGTILLATNTVMILATSRIVNGFDVHGYGPAFWGAAVLAVVGLAIRAYMRREE
jgi:putative membrane protein